MKTRNWILLGLALLAILAVVFVSIRRPAKVPAFEPLNPAYGQYVSAFSNGLISARSNIRVVLAYEYADSSEIGKAIPGRVIEFKPQIAGEFRWKDSRTIEFKPEKPLPQGENFQAIFKLDQFIDVPDSLSKLRFGFSVLQQDFKVEIRNLANYDWDDSRWKFLEGRLSFADAVSPDELEGFMKANIGNKNLKVRWTKESDLGYTFLIDSIERNEKARTLHLKWNGKDLGVKKNGSQDIEIPSLHDFKTTRAGMELLPSECVMVEFSDALMPNQDLRGLISMGSTNLTFTLEKNIVRAFYSGSMVGEHNLVISPGIKNHRGEALPRQSVHKIVIEDIKPALRRVGDGMILPSTEGLIFPFEAVSLRSVNVKVIQIFEKSIPQFLQNNELEGNSELYRVGKVLVKKTISLDDEGKTNLSQWNRYGIDLSGLIKIEPGAIYRVSLAFSRQNSIYPCTESPKTDEAAESSDEEEYDDYYYDDDYYYWGGNQWYDYSDFQDAGSGHSYYNWSDRENPCKDSYYYNKALSQNILASDLGITAKKFNDGTMSFLATDLVKSGPVSGASIKVLDFQLRTIAEGKSGSDGFLTLDVVAKNPFLVVAQYGKSSTYLPLSNSKVLSTSTFDIDGESVRDGVKGFIYTDRGVWRPGDTLFVNFILEDKLKQIPGRLPVVAELYNARGKLYSKQIHKNPVEGIYSFRFTTNPNDPTGSWRVQMRIGGSTFSKSLKVETVKPNRLKINLSIPGNQIDLANPKPIQIKADWLHGAVGKDLGADMVVSLRPDPEAFNKKYKDFIFQSPFDEFEMEPIKVAEGKTDDNGVFSFTPELALNNPPGVLKASITTKVYEKGGGFSINYSSTQVFPYASYVGLKIPQGSGWWKESLETGREHVFSMVDLDKQANPNKQARVRLTVYKTDWYWWWHRGSGSLMNFLSRPGTVTHLTKTYTLPSGSGTFKFKVDNKDYGNYLFVLTDLESGHTAASSVYLYWADAPSQEKREGANLLTLSTDKESYNVGETVTVSLPSSEGAHILFSLETSGRQLYREMVQSKSGKTEFKFKAQKNMTPNIYVYASLINPHASTAKGIPLRMYGIIPVMVEDPVTRLNPQITMPDEVRPESKVNIKVNEASGKAMAYTIAIVDDGLLDLTSFKTPDPWKYFYAKEALGVKTWDLYDQVIGATGGKFEKTLSIGGGDDGTTGEKGSTRANRFKPMVIHLGPFYLKQNASASHTVSIPKYIGSVRVMVVAAKDQAYGSAEKTVKVNSPLMVLGSLPRVAGPKEEIFLPVTVFAMKPEVKDVQIQLKTNALFEIIGNSKASVKFNKPGEAVVNFRLRCKEAVGVAKVEITSVSGNHRSSFEVEMDVRSANPFITNSQSKMLNPGESFEIDIKPFGVAGTNSGILQVSSLPPMNLHKRLQYLIQYPHGCIEQIVSGAFPQLFLSNLIQLSAQEEADVAQNVNSVISRLSSFQRDDGGFNYWPGTNYLNNWASSYAGHFLLEAKLKGYQVPDHVLKDWVQSQKQIARMHVHSDYYSSDLVQAYRLYTLALSGNPELGLMNRLKEQPSLTPQARWRLAAAYATAGRTSIAREIISSATTNIQEYREMTYSFGSATRDLAMILETMALLNDKEAGSKIMLLLAKNLASESWYSTQTTAYTLLSISKFIGKSGNTAATGLDLRYTFNGAQNKKLSSSREMLRTELGTRGKLGAGKLRVENTGKNIVYVEVFLEGQPLAGKERSESSNLYMDVEYTDLQGNSIDVSKLQQGTDFYAVVTVKHPGVLGPYKEMALTQIFPSGWEIINRRMEEDESYDYSFDYQDIKDDRVMTYFSISSRNEKVIRLQLNAAYQGRFYMAGTLCEAMYDKSISSTVKGSWVEVIE